MNGTGIESTLNEMKNTQQQNKGETNMTLIKYPTSRHIAGIDEIFKTFLNDFTKEPTVWRPAINVVEKNESIQVTYALPGFTKEEIRITVEKGVLTVKAEHPESTKEEGLNYLMHEISDSTSVRKLELPENINDETIEAEFKNGMLMLTLVKKEEALAKEIPINIK
jgi:HSP20 family protein